VAGILIPRVFVLFGVKRLYLNLAKPANQKTDQEKLERFSDQPAQQTHLAMTEIGLVGVALTGRWDDCSNVQHFLINFVAGIHNLSGSKNL
jgi:hypothetical protein